MPAIHGLEPTLRPDLTGFDSAATTAVVACFVVNALLFPVLMRLWREFFKELSHPRRRNDMASEHTVPERWVMAAATIQTLLMEAVVLFAACRPEAAGFGALAALTLLTTALMASQTVGYLLVGYSFAPAGEIRPWLRAFVTSNSILGYLLAVPALGALFYPEASALFIAICALFFIGCRMLFYIKGFTIFYTSPASLFYFFLYLCTLEITPVLAVWAVARYFLNIFN